MGNKIDPCTTLLSNCTQGPKDIVSHTLRTDHQVIGSGGEYYSSTCTYTTALTEELICDEFLQILDRKEKANMSSLSGKNVGFLGAGMMAEAIIQGLLSKGMLAKEQVGYVAFILKVFT